MTSFCTAGISFCMTFCPAVTSAPAGKTSTHAPRRSRYCYRPRFSSAVGAIVNMENAADFPGCRLLYGLAACLLISQELFKRQPSRHLWSFYCKGACGLERRTSCARFWNTVVFPGLLLAYFPVRSYLEAAARRSAAGRVLPLLLGLCLGGGLLCYCFNSRLRSPAGLSHA